MKLAFPHALWLLALVPALVFLTLREARLRRARLARLGELSLVSAQALGVSPQRRLWRRLLMVAAFTCVVVGLAGPKFGDRTELLPRRGLDVVFAVDVSRSMRARDVLPDRLERAKAELVFALSRLGENRVGLVAFAGTAFVQCPLTTDAEALRAFVRSLAPETVPQGGTMLAAGLDVAANLFASETEAGPGTAGRVLVVVTDGEDHEGDLEKAAERLKQLGVHTFFIGIGSGLGEPIPVSKEKGQVTEYLKDREGNTVMTRMSPETLEQLAALTGGRFIDGTRDPTLGIEHVESQVAQLEKRDLEARVRTTYVDRSGWPFGAGLLLLLLGVLLGEAAPIGRRARPIAPLGLFALLLLLSPHARAEEPSGFTREEPHIVEGFQKLQRGDFSGAIDAYRKAEIEDREQRAVVEYNVGVALLEKARQLAKAAEQDSQGPEGAPGQPNPALEEIQQELTTTLQEAQDAFDRSRSLSSEADIRSDAALAAGNAKAAAGDLKGAVTKFRDAVVDNPDNGRARANLRHALRALAAQPPPPPNEGGEDDDSEKEEGDDEKNDDGESGEQGDDKSDEDKQDEGDEQKKDGEQDDKEKDKDQDQGDEQKDDQNKDQQHQNQKGDEQDQKDQQPKNPGADKQEDKPEDLTREEARRILDALREREKPLNPFQMRGAQPKTRRVEKEW
jgi:Ca-activated chloride channel family protein